MRRSHQIVPVFTRLYHSHLLLAAVLFLYALVPASAGAQSNGEQKHMLWTLSKDGETAGYLVGSIHYMKPNVYPLPSAYNEAFPASDVLVFETNLDNAQAKAQGLIQKPGIYAGQKTLESALADSTYAMLKARADTLGLQLARMQRMEPWGMSVSVPITQMRKAGYSGKSGIDRHFFTKAKEASKTPVFLETPSEQLGSFDRFPPDRQEAYLHHSLREADRNVEMIDDMAAAWRRGDTERLEALVQDEMQTRFPDLYRSLIVNRNRDWTPTITDLLTGKRHPMIVVGAGHVVGEDGLGSMLRDEGCTVKQQ